MDEEDLGFITLEGGAIESVENFPYLGSLIERSGRMDAEVDRRVAQASKAIGALRKSVFMEEFEAT